MLHTMVWTVWLYCFCGREGAARTALRSVMTLSSGDGDGGTLLEVLEQLECEDLELESSRVG